MEKEKFTRRELQDNITEDLLRIGKKEKDDIIRYLTKLRTDELKSLSKLLNIDPTKVLEAHPGIKKICAIPIKDVLKEWRTFILENEETEVSDYPRIGYSEQDDNEIQSKSIPDLLKIFANDCLCLKKNQSKTMESNFAIGRTLELLFNKKDKNVAWVDFLAEHIPHYSQVHIDYFRRIWNRHNTYPLLKKAPVPMNTFNRLSKKIQIFLANNENEARFWRTGIYIAGEQKDEETEVEESEEFEEDSEYERLFNEYQEHRKKYRKSRRVQKGQSSEDPRDFKFRTVALDKLKTKKEKFEWLKNRKERKRECARISSRKISSRKKCEKTRKRIREKKSAIKGNGTIKTMNLRKKIKIDPVCNVSQTESESY